VHIQTKIFLLYCVRILVGAPKDNITDSGAPSIVTEFVRPGVVYQCPLTPLSDDCIDVKIDRERKFFLHFFYLQITCVAYFSFCNFY